MAYELQADPDKDTATRMGEFAMLIYSIVAVVAGATLPRLARRDTRLLAHEGDDADDDAELARLRTIVMEWRADAARKGQPIRLPWMPFFLRNIWSGAMILFAVITLSTFFITKVWQVRWSLFRTKRHFIMTAGCDCCELGRHLLGRRLLVSLRYHHGGLSVLRSQQIDILPTLLCSSSRSVNASTAKRKEHLLRESTLTVRRTAARGRLLLPFAAGAMSTSAHRCFAAVARSIRTNSTLRPQSRRT